MSQTLTRRSLVKATPAAVLAVALPAIALAAGAHLDAALLALREPYERTLAGIEVVSPAHTRAEDAFFAARQAQPHLDECALRKATGLERAERIYNAAVDANTDIICQVAETPARTIEGLFFKARVAEQEDYNPDVAASIVDDLNAMAGGANA